MQPGSAFELPGVIRTVARPTSHHRVILKVRVGLGEFVELRLVVQIRIRNDKTAELFSGVSFDVGDSVNFRQIASHGGGAAASRHVRHAQRHKNSIDSLCGSRRCCKRIRRCGSWLFSTTRHRHCQPTGQQHWDKPFHYASPSRTRHKYPRRIHPGHRQNHIQFQ